MANLAASSSPSAAGFASAQRAFVDLDERLARLASDAAAGGVLVARTPGEVTDAVLAHVARRVRASGRVAIEGRAGETTPLWRDVASRLSVGRLPCDPARCADQIGAAASLRRAVVVARLPRDGTWDRAVAVELAARPAPPAIVFVSDGDDAQDLDAERYEIDAVLDDEAQKRWWSALAAETRAMVLHGELAALESWWEATRRAAGSPARAVREVPASGAALFASLALAGRAWPAADVGALGGDATQLAALVSAGAVTDGAFAGIAATWEPHAREALARASLAQRATVAHALMGIEPEPWALARAAEILAHGDADDATVEAADRAIARALAGADAYAARREIVARWLTAVEAFPAAARRELLARTAERALAAGEPDDAHRCAKHAAAIGPEDARVLLILGRASMAMGDLVAARVALDHARDAASGHAETAALVACDHAEVAYIAGDVAGARAGAQAAIAETRDPATRLRARNTLGKLLLAEAKWDEADAHFVEDGMLAAAIGDVTGELRARSNRALALMSKGRVDEARVVFDGVLADAECRGEPRACAYALSNLTVVAMRRKEYGAALEYSERSIKLLHVMRDRMAGARALANLAELRMQLGLFDHSEHALSFGRRALGAAMTAGRASHFGVVAARLALARGRTTEARREIESAIALCEQAGVRDYLGLSFHVAARIALEDGDLGRAEAAIARAEELASNDEARAEIALIHALYDRARGASSSAARAEQALMLARSADEETLAREAHVLLAELLRASGNVPAARAHSVHATTLRDKVAASLSSEVRTAFLARPDVVHLTRLHASLVAEPSAAPVASDESARGAPPTRPSESSRSAPRELVGDDPAIRGLLAAIKKVARSSSTVLVRGESGTGKELVAEALHRASDRAGGPLVTVNCAALVETLLLSELFGHEKGAFTGAFARRRGRFELAEGGTLFLDEIGDISPRTQVALLRVLQERTFERVGGTMPIRANVRIVCATHRDLRAMVERGEFREDLYYRLRGITLEVPALRARMGDLPRIAAALLARIAVERGEPASRAKSLSTEALNLLARHRWPGNVRELENALRAASLFAESDVIEARDLVDNVEDLRAVAVRATPVPPAPSSDDAACDDADGDAPLPANEAGATSAAYAQVRQGVVSLSDMKRQIERDCIARALAETKGNITRAAALLGMKRPRLSQLVKQYGLAAVSSEAP